MIIVAFHSSIKGKCQKKGFVIRDRRVFDSWAPDSILNQVFPIIKDRLFACYPECFFFLRCLNNLAELLRALLKVDLLTFFK